MKSAPVFEVEGLAGKRTLRGTISVAGSKNAALPLLASSLLFKTPVSFRNVPQIADIENMRELLEGLGVKTERGERELSLDSSDARQSELESSRAKKMRGSVVLTGPLLARFGSASFPHPGGCVIGERPIDLFLSGFEKMGASVEVQEGNYVLSAASGLSGAEIFFPLQSVTGTETFLMAAALAKGRSVIKNAALEPEVVHLGEFLISGGARISGLGTTTITIEGSPELLQTKEAWEIMPDRIEAGSFLIVALLCGEDIEITDCNPAHLEALIDTLRRTGAEFEVREKGFWISAGRTEKLHARNIRTHEYPGFPTDLQAPMAVYFTQVAGESAIFETIFEGRLNYCEELVRMGANIKVWNPHQAVVKGGTKLRGRKLESPDLRAGLAYLIAALVAEGKSTLGSIHLIDRGYERIEERLSALGAKVIRRG